MRLVVVEVAVAVVAVAVHETVDLREEFSLQPSRSFVLAVVEVSRADERINFIDENH